MLFTSDNWAGVHPKIMDAIVEANGDPVPAYGADPHTELVTRTFSEMFGVPVTPAFVATGSAANSLALASVVPPWGVIFCYANGHIHLDEAAAPEFYTGGAKIVTLPGTHGKIEPSALDDAMRFYTPPQTHHAVPAALSITQGTEAGTVYTPREIAALCECAHGHGLIVHMDGARFANACAALGASPKELTVDVGVDVLTLGGTKNGCMVAEAIIFFDPSKAESLPHRQKRAGQGFSKARFLAAQWQAYFADDLWFDLARQANRMAAALSKRLAIHPECRVVHPTEINEVFVAMPDHLAEELRAGGASFYDWVQPDDPYDGELRRLVTSFATTSAQVQAFTDLLDGMDS